MYVIKSDFISGLSILIYSKSHSFVVNGKIGLNSEFYKCALYVVKSEKLVAIMIPQLQTKVGTEIPTHNRRNNTIPFGKYAEWQIAYSRRKTDNKVFQEDKLSEPSNN